MFEVLKARLRSGTLSAMATSAQHVLAEAMRLSDKERGDLVRDLLDSFADPPTSVEPGGSARLVAFKPGERPETGRRKNRRSGPALAETLMTISRRCSSLPDLDTRSVDEILGYDESGAFR